MPPGALPRREVRSFSRRRCPPWREPVSRSARSRAWMCSTSGSRAARALPPGIRCGSRSTSGGPGPPHRAADAATRRHHPRALLRERDRRRLRARRDADRTSGAAGGGTAPCRRGDRPRRPGEAPRLRGAAAMGTAGAGAARCVPRPPGGRPIRGGTGQDRGGVPGGLPARGAQRPARREVDRAHPRLHRRLARARRAGPGSERPLAEDDPGRIGVTAEPDWGVDSEHGRLLDVLLCRPDNFRWLLTSAITRATLEAGYEYDGELAANQHASLVAAYEEAGVRCHFLDPDPALPYQVFARDSRAMGPN